jgi:hypothetical protein
MFGRFHHLEKKGPQLMRKLSAALALVLLIVPAAQAGQDSLAGNWKITFLDHDQLLTFWILKLEAKDGKLSGAVESTDKVALPPTTVHDLGIKDGQLKFTLKLKVPNDPAGLPIGFTCKVPKGEVKKLHGVMNLQASTMPVQLEATKLDTLKDSTPITQPTAEGNFKELKNKIAKDKDDIGVFQLLDAVIGAAVTEKVGTADLKEVLAPLLKAAGEYSSSWQQDLSFDVATRLARREGYAAYGEELARQALKDAGPSASADLQMRGYGILATSLEKQGKKVEAAQVQETIAGLEVKGHEENEKAGLGFQPAKFDGRKGNKVVLVELFTGAQCPPCVAADLAFEALAKTYPTSEVVLLQYHLHIPGPDPMANQDTIDRQKYYGNAVRSTPTIFFNGKSEAGGGGGKAQAEDKYKQYREVINPLLEGQTKIQLSVDAQRAGDLVTISAKASGYKASDKLKLHFALVEPWVRYAGNNGLSYHAHVVRALPGGPAGFTLSKDNASESAKLNLADLRQQSSKGLDEFPNLEGQRPFSYRNLRVVAFIQDDETHEVLAAVEVLVK